MQLDRNFEFTKAPRESVVAAYDYYCLAHPMPSHTPDQERPSISKGVVSCEELWRSANDLQTFCWGLFLSIFVHPK